MIAQDKKMEPTIFQRLTQSTWLRQAVKFGMVGVINTLVDAGVYFALTRWAGMIDLPVLAKAISYSCGVLNSFFWNRLWTFRSKQNSWKNFALFVLVNLIGVGINSSVMAIGMNSLHLIEVGSFLLATAASLGWNFLMSKRVVFRT